jgi:hypothetical protein
LRFNKRSGEADFVDLPKPHDWLTLKDKEIDVAALPLDPDGWLKEVEFVPVPFENLCTDEVISSEDIGIGDDLLVTGLFSNHPGSERNIPIVRSGIISAMPVDQLKDVYIDGKKSKPYTAYLVELRSTGGLSGSPVFVVIGPARIVTHMGPSLWDAGGGIGMVSFRLLGVIRGHWYTDAEESEDPLYDGKREINRGVAKVTPAKFLKELLLMPVEPCGINPTPSKREAAGFNPRT